MAGQNAGGVARTALDAMGTRFEFVIIAEKERDAGLIAERATELVEAYHHDLSRFAVGGVVTRLNRAATRAVRVGPEVGDLLRRCLGYAADSGDAFSAIRRGDSFVPMRQALFVSDRGDEAGLAADGMSLDLGGVAKGFAFDMIREELDEFALIGAFLHGGTSTMTALGAPPDAEPWTVRLDPGDGSPAPTVRLRDRAMSVSSQQGDRPNHIVDPRTGEPAVGCGFAGCIGESAEETDAWSTALTVLGKRPGGMPDRLTSVIRSASRWIVEGPDAGAVELPAGM